MSLRGRVLVVAAGVAVAATAIAGVLLRDLVSDEVEAGLDARISTALHLLESELSHAGAPAGEAALDARIDAAAGAVDVRFTVVSPEGRVLADSEFDGRALAALDDHSSREEVIEAWRNGEGRVVRYSRSVGTALFYRARRLDGGPWEGSVVRVAVPATRFDRARASAARRLAGGGALALALALLAGAWLARRVGGPLEELGRTADRAAAGELSARARLRTGDEAEDLARRWNAALAAAGRRLASAAEERDRLSAVVDAMVEGVVVTDGSGRIVLANPALRDLFAVERDVVGKTPVEALRHAEVDETIREAAASGEAVAREVVVAWPAPRTLALHAVGMAGGGAVGVFEDVTALKRAEAVRRDFVANVSHELQTPLATIAAHAEEALDPGTPEPDVREATDVIARQAGRLSELVRDLLELARVESRGFRPETEPVDVAALVEELGREWRPRLEAAGRTLEVESDPDAVLEAEPTLLRRAVENLLENALKHGREGPIVLAARAEPDAVAIEVSDAGPGIPAEDRPRIFERFYRVEKGRARATGGTGLGLAIVKHVAEVHGGAVSVDSRPGKGARFRLVLPREGPARTG